MGAVHFSVSICMCMYIYNDAIVCIENLCFDTIKNSQKIGRVQGMMLVRRV